MKLKLIAAAAILTLSSPMAWAASSSFQNSCQNITMNTTSEAVTFTADCRTQNGNYNTTSIQFRGLTNNNGRLQVERGAQTSYQHSCRDRGIRWNANKFWIRAICKTAAGEDREATLEIYNIENRNGRLVYASN